MTDVCNQAKVDIFFPTKLVLFLHLIFLTAS